MWNKFIKFVHFLKMYPDRNFHAKKLECLKKNTIFSTKGTKSMLKKPINFSDWNSDWNFIHFFQLKQVNAWENKVWLPIFPCQKASLFEIEYTSFNQRKEMYVKEDYQFLAHFKKSILSSSSMPKNFSVRNWI